MEQHLFSNAHILAWLQYFADNTEVDLERVKILDITRRNKNLIPTVESHPSTLVFTGAGHPDIFYRMFNAGLGECTVVYNEGSEPSGPICRSKVYDMIGQRGINASAAMLLLNPNARSTFKFGMDNQAFTPGSVRYVGSEIRAVLLSKMQVSPQKNLCVISGESIAVEAAIMAGEGTVIAVEYSARGLGAPWRTMSASLDSITWSLWTVWIQRRWMPCRCPMSPCWLPLPAWSRR